MLLKNALLLGVRLLYGTTLVGVQSPGAPTPFSQKGGQASWHCWAKGGWSSDDFKAPVLSAAALEAAERAVDDEDEAERINIAMAAVPDVISSAMVDLSEELNVIQKGSVKGAMAALQRQSVTGGSGPASPASASKPTRKKALAMTAMFEAKAAEAEPSPRTPQTTPKKASEAASASKKVPGSPLDLGALDFKPNKMSDYERAATQGLCNFMQTSDLDATFALAAGAAAPEGADSQYPFDALLLAEGEWSSTCKKLAVTKAIDRFSLAIGRTEDGRMSTPPDA